MDIVIANSKNVQQRIEKYLGASSIIVYPPIQIDKFKWLGQKDYYLSFGRVDRLKRIPDIVRSFQLMPHKKIIIASGGNELDRVKLLSAGYKNIKVLGWVSDSELKELIGYCIATLYIPINEDFGMTPLESMSAGKPCLGVYDGGLKETILNEKTGKFIPPDYTIDDIVKAVEWLTPQRALSMRKECEERARDFSFERFISSIKHVIQNENSY